MASRLHLRIFIMFAIIAYICRVFQYIGVCCILGGHERSFA